MLGRSSLSKDQLDSGNDSRPEDDNETQGNASRIQRMQMETTEQQNESMPGHQLVEAQRNRTSKRVGAALFNKSVAPWFEKPVDLSPLARGRPHFHGCERLTSAKATANPDVILRRVYEFGQPLILTNVIDGERFSRDGGAALQQELLRESGHLKVDVSVDWSLEFQRPTDNGTLLNPASKTATLAEFFDLVRSQEEALKHDGQPPQEVYNLGQERVSPKVLRALRLDQPKWMQMLCGEAPLGECGKLNLWVATNGKRSLLHFDRYENALLQVVGTKRLRLIDSLHMDKVYPSVVPREHLSRHAFASFGRQTQRYGTYGSDNFAPLRLDDKNVSSKFPRFDHKVVTHCMLEPGEMLLLPAYWWHDVVNEAPANQGLQLNIAANFWFEPQRLSNRLMDGLAYNFFRLSQKWSELSYEQHPLIEQHEWKPPSAAFECANGRPAFHSFDWTFVDQPGSKAPAVVDAPLPQLESLSIYTIVWLQSRPMLFRGQPPEHWSWPAAAEDKMAKTIMVHAAPDDRFDSPQAGVLRRALRAPFDDLPPGWPETWHSFVAKQPSIAMPPPLKYLMPDADAVEEFGQSSAKFAWHYSPRVRALLAFKGTLKARIVDFLRSSAMQVERLKEADLMMDGSLQFTGRVVHNFSSCRSCAKHSESIELKRGELLLVPAHWWLSLSISGPWKLVTWTSQSEHVFTSRVVDFLSETQWAQPCPITTQQKDVQ